MRGKLESVFESDLPCAMMTSGERLQADPSLDLSEGYDRFAVVRCWRLRTMTPKLGQPTEPDVRLTLQRELDDWLDIIESYKKRR